MSCAEQAVHDRVLLHLIALLSRHHEPTEQEVAVVRTRLHDFAPLHNFTFCSTDGEAVDKETPAKSTVGAALAYVHCTLGR